MSRIRVLHIVWSAPLGGIERIVFNLIKTQLQKNQVHPDILVAKSDGINLDHFIDLGIKVYQPGFLKGNDTRSEILNSCKTAFSEYDILHFHSYNPTLAKIAVNSGKKIVYTEHGNFGFGRKTSFKDFLIRLFQRRFLNKQVDFITFNSEFTKKTAESRFNLSRVKRQVVYNGTPVISNSIQNPELDFFPKTEKIKVLTVGRLAAVKKIDRLIKAFADADPVKMQLIITGDGPLRKELENLCQYLNITEQVCFTGFRDSLSVMKLADICVFPSQNEAFGLVAIEAYQLGKPVVVFQDGGGLTELVEKIEPNMIVKNEHELSALLIKSLISQSEFNSEERINARKKFAAEFSIEKMETTFSTIYFSL